MIKLKGTEPFPSLFIFISEMDNKAVLQQVEEKITALLSAEPDLFLVEIKMKPTNNIKAYIDGDQGISIERLVQINRSLYKQIEEMALFPEGDFSLEVSSPGLDEPLKLPRQYKKNTGRFIEVINLEGEKTEGKLIAVNENELVLETTRGKGKKLETQQQPVLLNTIKSTKVQIKF